MRTHSIAVAALAACTLGISLASAAEPPRLPAREQLAKASERLLDLTKAGPITMRYGLRFPGGREGTYVLVQRNRENFREDIRVGQLAVADGAVEGRRWRSAGDEALELRWLVDTLFEFRARLEPETDDALTVRTVRIGGADCIEVRTATTNGRTGWSVLLDAASLDPRVSESLFEWIAYGDWKELPGTGRFPGACRISLQDDVVLDMVLGSATNKPVNDADLAAPAGAVELPGCEGEDEPKLVHRTSPIYPEPARLDRAQGFVVVSGVIQTDGSVTGLRLVHAPKAAKQSQKMLVDAAIAAVSRWRYEPARCHGAPTPANLDVVVTFKLQ